MRHVLSDVLYWEWVPLAIVVGAILWIAFVVILGIEAHDLVKPPKSRQGDEEDPFEERFNK